MSIRGSVLQMFQNCTQAGGEVNVIYHPNIRHVD